MYYQKRIYVYCTYSFEAIHRWSNCNIEEVEFLKYPHRHKFNCRVKVEVNHNDRDIEFIVLSRRLKEFINANILNDCSDIGTLSCEMIAEKIFDYFNLLYPNKNYWEIEVNEDGENGAILNFYKNGDDYNV